MKVPTRLGILAAVAASAFAYARVVRPWQLTWGATPDEVTRALPGDDLVQGAYRTTHAVTIARPPGEVWPWLVQMGYERGGWYSYDRLERAIGIGDFAEGGSARRIIPHLQSLTLGDAVALSENGGFTVVGLDPARSLVLRIPMDPLTGGPASAHSRVVLDWTWAFVLEPVDQGCRLLIRVRGDLRPHWLIPALLLLDPVHLIMERKMLRTIKQCAEAHGPKGHRHPFTGEAGSLPIKQTNHPETFFGPGLLVADADDSHAAAKAGPPLAVGEPSPPVERTVAGPRGT